MKDSGFGSFLAGVVVGGLIGAAVGLLLAPASGNETREQVGEFVGERRAQLEEAINEGRSAADKARAELLAAYDAAEGGAAPEGATS